jgi:hypothetical protein
VPSFLVTRRMSPELAARVLESVSGRRSSKTSKRLAPLAAVLRLATFALLTSLVALLLYVRHQRAQKLERDRSSLLGAMRAAGSSLTRSDRELRRRVEAALAAQAAPVYAGDTFADELRSEPRLAAELALPTLYVRGPLDGFASPGRLLQVAPSSFKDALLRCLLDPPDARTEKALKAKARGVLSQGAAATSMAHVERLDPLLQALPLLEPAWQKRIQAAESDRALAGYQKLFDVAPVRAAVRAAKARQLLAVMDEPGDPKAPAELDGERPHAVRVTLIDLTSDQIRLRYRGLVDPSWLSAPARAQHASGIDSCALALDLRSALLGPPQLATAPAPARTSP